MALLERKEEELDTKSHSPSANRSSIYTWRGFSGELGLFTHGVFSTVDIVKVSLGSGHSLFQSRDGDVYVCGDNSKGQLGLGTLEVTRNDEPVKVDGFSEPACDISCGDFHCGIVNRDGNAFFWGDSTNGQCGVGTLELVLSPTPVVQEFHDGFCKEHGLPKPKINVLFESISCGAQHSLAVSTDGEVWAWGYGIPLGLGEILHAPIPRRVTALKEQVAVGVCCGKRHSMVMVLKDKSKVTPANSPQKSITKAKEIEVDKHYPSRCKSCKKEIFSYTDTSDMCIVETLHDCETRITRSDDSTVVEDDFPASSDDVNSNSFTGSKNIACNASSSPQKGGAANERDPNKSQAPTANTSNLSSLNTSPDKKIDKTSECVSSVSQGIVSPSEETQGEDVLGDYSSVPETTLDGSLLSLPADVSLVDTETKELSPTKSSDSSKDLYMDDNGTSFDEAKVLFKSDNSIANSAADDNRFSTDGSSLSLSSEPALRNRGGESGPSDQSKQSSSETNLKERKSDEGEVGGSQDSHQSLKQSQSDNPVYGKSFSVDSDEVVWKRQSASVDEAFHDFNLPERHGRPSSPSAISTKSLGYINQSEAREYLQRQFEDDDVDRPKKQRDIDKKEIQALPASPGAGMKTEQGGSALPYTSMVMEQVKSMTSRALTNFQSFNVLRSLSGDSPTLEMALVSKTEPVEKARDSADVESCLEDRQGPRTSMTFSAEPPKDEVFSSPESCSMISSVGSLTGEDVGVSKDASEDKFQARLKSGTFMEWKQEMSSAGENGTCNRRSLRTIQMQKRNLSSSSGPSVQTETLPPLHRPVITTTEIWVWGHNADGQLGIGDTIDRPEPVWLKSLSGRNVMKLAAGDSHSIAMTDNSQIYTWGSNSHGQLGQSKTTDCPSRVKFPKGNTVWDVAAGAQHSLFLGDISAGPPDVYYCGKQPNEETNASLKKTAVPSPISSIKENGWMIRVFAGGTKCSCKVLRAAPHLSQALFELAASERSFYGQLIKTSNLLLRPLRRSAFFSSLDVFPYKSTLQSIIASFGLLTTKIGRGVTDLTATIQHDDCPSFTHLIKDREEFLEAFKNYSRVFSDFLAVGGFEYCTRTGSEFFTEIQGNIQDLPGNKEKTNASSSLFLRAMRYPFYRLSEYSRLITKMVHCLEKDCEEKKVYQDAVLDWEGLKVNFSSEHKAASYTKTFWDSISTRLADSLRQPNRRVVRESKTHPLILPSAGRFTSQLFVLFNDVFLHFQNNVQVLHPLVTLWVESGNNEAGQQNNTLIVTSPEERFEFSCPSSTLKTEWLMEFKSAISRILTNEKSLNSLHSSGERFTPPLIRHAEHKFIKVGIYKDAHFNGTWLSGKVHGLGKMTWSDGSFYSGNFKLGLMHGQGTFTQVRGQNQEVQKGSWRDGKLNGMASIVYANGDVYEGHVKDGLRHGHGMLQTGRIKSNCASIYIGEWVANLRHGYGVEDDILKGEKYMGMWSEDNRHGNGIMVTLDGMYFEGNFVHNKLTGFGVMISDDDTLYEGDFVGITHLSGKKLILMLTAVVLWLANSARAESQVVFTNVKRSVSDLGTLTLPSGDKLEGAFSGSLNGGLKINGSFLKATGSGESDNRHQPSHGAKSRYFGKLCISADEKWTDVFSHSYSSLGQGSNNQQRNDMEKAWEAVAVTVSEGLKLLKKQQGTNSTKYKVQQSILEELEKIPSHDQESLDLAKVESISLYLTKAFESSYHPLGQLMNTLVDVFRASYIGVGAHPRLLHHAVLEVKSYVHRVYGVIRLLFPILPMTKGPVYVRAPPSPKGMVGVLPEPSQSGNDSEEDDPNVTIFTAAGLLYPILLPKIYPPLFDLYALYNEWSDDRYWERVTKLNRQGDVGLMAYLGIEQQFWLIQDILDEGKAQALSTIKDICYAEAVDHLQQMSTAFSPVEKLKVIEKTFNQITQTVTEALGDEIMWCMDDLFPIFQFVVVRAKLHHLGAEIHLIEDLMEPHLEHGEFGLMFTTLKACYFQIQNEKMPHH